MEQAIPWKNVAIITVSFRICVLPAKNRLPIPTKNMKMGNIAANQKNNLDVVFFSACQYWKNLKANIPIETAPNKKDKPVKEKDMLI